jgi:putative FmdB family regulatory protein
MPIYEYKCEDCLKIFERLLPTMSNRKKKCPWCGKMCEKMMSTSNFHLDNTKGVGWGKDGYNRKGSAFTDREIKRPKTNFRIDPNKSDDGKKPKIKVK